MNELNKQDFIELYSRNQKTIFLYILGMVHSHTDAEDIMQQTALEMWRLFEHFKKGTNFSAWGISVASYRVLDFRKKNKKDRCYLSDEVYAIITQELPHIGSAYSKRRDALQGCLTKLKDSDRLLLTMHYEDNVTYKKIAESLNLSKSGIYKVMARIHDNLQKCIHNTLLLWTENG